MNYLPDLVNNITESEREVILCPKEQANGQSESIGKEISLKRLDFNSGWFCRPMSREGEAVAVSSDAGAYVCNDTYYLTGVGSRVPVVFIHVPAVPENAAAYAGTVRRFIELAVGAFETD